MQHYHRCEDEIAAEKASLEARIDKLAALIAQLKDSKAFAQNSRKQLGRDAVVLLFKRHRKE